MTRKFRTATNTPTTASMLQTQRAMRATTRSTQGQSSRCERANPPCPAATVLLLPSACGGLWPSSATPLSLLHALRGSSARVAPHVWRQIHSYLMQYPVYSYAQHRLNGRCKAPINFWPVDVNSTAAYNQSLVCQKGFVHTKVTVAAWEGRA